MKQERIYPQAAVTPKAERALLGGHPWVYDTEILRAPQAENGSIVDVVNAKGRYLGSGFLSTHSKIRIRVFSRNANDIFDAVFWRRRLSHAWEYRKTVLDDVSCCRLVFGEADLFPGLTVDRFGSLLVAQTLSVGIERLKGTLFPLLVQLLREDGQEVAGLYERNDAALRLREGLCAEKGWFDLSALGLPTPESARVPIVENGVRYEVDVENGQKTGFFLDHKFNRRAVARVAGGNTVLDCFTHTGSFALNAARGGAKRVTAVDVSAEAVEMAARNAARNGLADKVDCVQANVFELLPQLAQRGSPYDFIILDPPAFTKSRRTAQDALRGYKEINYRAMKLLPRGGYLATCSCSHFVTDAMFRAMLADAAHDAGVQLRQIEAAGQAPDHPVLWGVEETEYLKFYLFQVF